MDFLDSIRRASEDTIGRAKDMADVAKLNSSISGENRIIDGLFMQLGKAYFELHAEDAEEPLAGTVSAIRRHRAEVAGYQQRVEALQAPRSAESGASQGIPYLPQQDNAAQMHCPNCGALVERRAFCNKCGIRLVE